MIYLLYFLNIFPISATSMERLFQNETNQNLVKKQTKTLKLD